MKIKSLFVGVLLMAGVVVTPAEAADNDLPVLESFTFSPNEIDTSISSNVVKFKIIVSHRLGINNQNIAITLKNSINDSLTVYAKRIDNPINSKLAKVIFEASLAIPADIRPGVYGISGSPVQSNLDGNNQYTTSSLAPSVVRNFEGAENSLLIRDNGKLYLDIPTFYGPSYDKSLGYSYKNSTKYASSITPILRVGESYRISDYFEAQIPGVGLNTLIKTPSNCILSQETIKFIAEGSCNISIFTDATNDYLRKSEDFSLFIKSGRLIPNLIFEKIPDQNVNELPKIITLYKNFSPSGDLILPKSLTPSICLESFYNVKILRDGVCQLRYKTEATDIYFASADFIQSFQVTDVNKPVIVPTPTPTATPTAQPVVKKTITCVKGKKSVKRTGTNPKCPAGYKLKK